MTQRIAWLKGKDNQGKTRYAPASAFTTQSFATLVLGNIYAAVETVVGYGIQSSAPSDWRVFDTLEDAMGALQQKSAS